MFSCPQLSSGVFRCPQLASGMFRCPQLSSGVFRCPQVCSGVLRCPQVVMTLLWLFCCPLPALFLSSFIFIPPRVALNSGPKRQIHNMWSSVSCFRQDIRLCCPSGPHAMRVVHVLLPHSTSSPVALPSRQHRVLSSASVRCHSHVVLMCDQKLPTEPEHS